MKIRTLANLTLGSWLVFYASFSFSGVCADGKDADGLKKAGEKGYCIAVQTFASNLLLRPNDVLSFRSG